MLPRDFFPFSDTARRGLRYAGAQATILAGMVFIMIDEEDSFHPWRNMAGCCLILAGWALHPNPGWLTDMKPGRARGAPAAAPGEAHDSLAGALWQSTDEAFSANIRSALQTFLGMGHALSYCYSSTARYSPALGAWGMFGAFGILPRAMRLATRGVTRRGVPDFHHVGEALRYLCERLAVTMLTCSVASLQSGLTGLFFFPLDAEERYLFKVEPQRIAMHRFGFLSAWSHFVCQCVLILIRFTTHDDTRISRNMDFLLRLPGLAISTWTLTYPPGWQIGRAQVPASYGPQNAAVEILDLLMGSDGGLARFPEPRVAPMPLSAANGPAPAPPPFPEAPYAGGPRLDRKHDRKNFPPVRPGARPRVVRLAGPGPGPGPAPVAMAAVVRMPTPGYLSPYALPVATVGNAPGGPPLLRDHKSR